MTTHLHRHGSRRRAVLRAVVTVALVAAIAPSAQAAGPTEFVAFDASLSEYKAGGHPDSTVSFDFATEPAPGPLGQPGGICGDPCLVVKGGAPKDIVVDAPKGVYAAAQNAARCRYSDFSNGVRCPVDSQVGIITLRYIQGGVPGSGEFALFQLEPARGEVARFGFKAVAIAAMMSVKLRADGEYALRIESSNIFDGWVVAGAEVTIWGVPNDPSHDAQRKVFGSGNPGIFGTPAASPRKPFMVAPSECGVDGITTIRARSWADPGTWIEAESTPRQVTGCDLVEMRRLFDPQIEVEPSSSRPDAPSGVDFKLSLPQEFSDPDGVSASPLRDAVVRLPEGMSINPAAAAGLVACSDDQLGLGTGSGVECPLGSKIGTATVKTPVLDEVVEGSVFVRSQASANPESGEMFRLGLVLENQKHGILVKVPASVRLDKQTGQLETTFLDNPQMPVSEIELSFKGGPRAPLALPTECGQHTVEAKLAAWSGHRVTRYASFNVDCPANEPFEPVFSAGTVSPTGGSFSPFVAEIARREGDAYLSGVQLELPKGLIAKLAGVALCPDAVAGDGTPGACSAASRIGTATVGAGSGDPFYLKGDVYLTGPYGGGPYGLSVQVPAKAGPFDLGMVKVRQAVHVDADTGALSVVSDQLPQIVSGVPVRLRDVHVVTDRPGFTINPTSCAEKRIDSTLTAVDGQVHRTAERFQAGDCQSLAFKPRLAMRLSGKRQTKTGGHPVFKTVLTQGSGQAGIGRVRVAMPKSIVLDAKNTAGSTRVCDYDKSLAAEPDCPASTMIGKATAYTPVLNKPLTGPVHLVQGVKLGVYGNRIRTTPGLLVKLRGEVSINLRGQTATTKDNRLLTTFGAVPDAPVSRFSLQVDGGKDGILVVTANRKGNINICNSRQLASVQTDAQNGKQADYRTRIKTPCAKTVRKAKRAKRNP